MTMNWTGVMPAITTCFDENLQIDHEFTARHVNVARRQRLHGHRHKRQPRRRRHDVARRERSLWKTVIDVGRRPRSGRRRDRLDDDRRRGRSGTVPPKMLAAAA